MTTILKPPLKVLTIDPLWVWAIAERIKLVENRTWSTRHRGPLGIHASKNTRREEFARQWILSNTIYTPPDSEYLAREYAGRLIGVVDLVDCVELAEVPEREREFAIGPVCWRLANFARYNYPVQLTGKQGIWTYTEA